MIEKYSLRLQHAFTIVELLIVIVVIAILASISVVAYNGIQERSREAKVKSDIAAIIKAVKLAREGAGRNLISITGSSATGSPCWSKPDGTDLATLPANDTCYTRYDLTLSAISDASGSNIRGMRDPWGRPYLIDENESEGSATNCNRDTVAIYNLPHSSTIRIMPGYPGNNIPNAGFTGCAP